jgi:hypothetical protein
MNPSYFDHLSSGIKPLEKILCNRLEHVLVIAIGSCDWVRCFLLLIIGALVDLIVSEDILLDIRCWRYEKYLGLVLWLSINLLDFCLVFVLFALVPRGHILGLSFISLRIQ